MDKWYPNLGHWHFGKKRDRFCHCTRYTEPDGVSDGQDFEDDDQWEEVFSIYNDMTEGQQRYSRWN